MARRTAVERKRPWKFAPQKKATPRIYLFSLFLSLQRRLRTPTPCLQPARPGQIAATRMGPPNQRSAPPQEGGGAVSCKSQNIDSSSPAQHARYLTVSEPQSVPAQPHRPVVFTTDHAHRMETNTPDPLMRPAWIPTPPPLAVSLFLSLFFFCFFSLSLCCVLRHHCDTCMN